MAAPRRRSQTTGYHLLAKEAARAFHERLPESSGKARLPSKDPARLRFLPRGRRPTRPTAMRASAKRARRKHPRREEPPRPEFPQRWRGPSAGGIFPPACRIPPQAPLPARACGSRSHPVKAQLSGLSATQIDRSLRVFALLSELRESALLPWRKFPAMAAHAEGRNFAMPPAARAIPQTSSGKHPVQQGRRSLRAPLEPPRSPEWAPGVSTDTRSVARRCRHASLFRSSALARKCAAPCCGQRGDRFPESPRRRLPAQNCVRKKNRERRARAQLL